MLVSLEKAERVVARQRSKRDKFSWDGWTLVHRKPHGGAFMRSDGVWDNGWCIQRRFQLNDDGLYEIPEGLAGYFR